MRSGFGGSELAVRVALGAAIALAVLAIGPWPAADVADAATWAMFAPAVHTWCAKYGPRADLQAVLTDLHFRPEPPGFASGEGEIVAPVGLTLPGAQRVIDVESHPTADRRIQAGAITTLAWPYGGRAHREIRVAGMALVERRPFLRVPVTDTVTNDRLSADIRPEAVATVADLGDHSLSRCSAFAAWTSTASGDGPFPDRIARLATAVLPRVPDDAREGDDPCAAIRKGRFTSHVAHVLVVMGARQLGIPAFGFAAASAKQVYLVGTFTDQDGWILLDVERPHDGWFTGGPALVTMVPQIADFDAATHQFWSPVGAAFAPSYAGLQAFSFTEWRGRLSATSPATDTTAARSITLAEACR